MYCQRCGTQNEDNAAVCRECGNELQAANEKPLEEPVMAPDATSFNNAYNVTGERVPNYLVWSIIITVVSVFLCNFLAIPAGIVAIVFSTQVDSKLKVGDFEGALKSSKNAKIWNWVATGLAILSVVFWALVFIIAIIGSTQYMY